MKEKQTSAAAVTRGGIRWIALFAWNYLWYLLPQILCVLTIVISVASMVLSVKTLLRESDSSMQVLTEEAKEEK